MSDAWRRWWWRGGLRLAGLALALAAVTGCKHKTAYQPPPPPPLPQSYPPQTSETYPPQPQPQPPVEAPVPETENGVSQADLEYIETHKPVLTETGMATWYRDYKGRKQADGDPMDNDAMTAANRTLPLGSLVVVTNLKTGQSGAMHITDRGPFIQGRIVDLSIASAKAVGPQFCGRSCRRERAAFSSRSGPPGCPASRPSCASSQSIPVSPAERPGRSCSGRRSAALPQSGRSPLQSAGRRCRAPAGDTCSSFSTFHRYLPGLQSESLLPVCDPRRVPSTTCGLRSAASVNMQIPCC